MNEFIGKRFNMLTVLSFDHREVKPRPKGSFMYYYFYKCKCDCGNEIIMRKCNIQRKCQKGCGCQRKWTKKRFIEFIEKIPTSESGCKIWPKYHRPNGYAFTKYNGIDWSVHRLSYYFHFTKPKRTEVIMHSCDNRACVAPEHLSLGTQQDNVDEEKVKEIRKLKKNNTVKELSKMFNVSFGCIYDALSRRWKHVKEDI